MVKIIVESEKQAIDTARLIVQATNSILADSSRSDIEQTNLIDPLCKLRDSIIVEKPEDAICFYKKMDSEGNRWSCSDCGDEWEFNDGDPFDNDMNYCPNCGLKIEALVLWPIDGERSDS